MRQRLYGAALVVASLSLLTGGCIFGVDTSSGGNGGNGTPDAGSTDGGGDAGLDDAERFERSVTDRAWYAILDGDAQSDGNDSDAPRAGALVFLNLKEGAEQEAVIRFGPSEVVADWEVQSRTTGGETTYGVALEGLRVGDCISSNEYPEELCEGFQDDLLRPLLDDTDRVVLEGESGEIVPSVLEGSFSANGWEVPLGFVDPTDDEISASRLRGRWEEKGSDRNPRTFEIEPGPNSMTTYGEAKKTWGAASGRIVTLKYSGNAYWGMVDREKMVNVPLTAGRIEMDADDRPVELVYPESDDRISRLQRKGK